ncbi:FecR family protein [Aquimarina litoralis]|uniref:FecR family protein n=1 Tax=Aquimarina litoralis TaxID=584605 RepID=UPI001C57E081|nr:FecR family protein [Aquimarina litoralis]MBW1296927.1 DUF4974 domain-containing protein [Aquimarina litoralis]
MKKEDLIKKWLDNEQLTKQESEAFEKLDAYDSYVRISETAKQFKAPEYDVTSNLDIVTQQLKAPNTKTSGKTYFYSILRIAAVFVIGIGIYFSFFNEYKGKEIKTIASQKATITLPDNSIVKINATSSLAYDEKGWENNRELYLDGEAYFNVAKGKKFDVRTSLGVVSVIGTRFNVKQRENIFEVVCYEGIVSVNSNDQIEYLKAGDAIIFNSEISEKLKVTDQEPTWYTNKSYFNKTSYDRVLKELEWQYGVEVKTKNIDPTIVFTGNFVHSDIETALQSITIPMRLKYVINNKTVTLFKE